MEEKFDPYHQWLGIPPKDQPPHHYRLLGIDAFESNEQVIENAADRQMRHIRSLQSGKHSEAVQQLLNEISKARICLLSAEAKAAYDAQLRQHNAPRPVQAQPLPQAQALPVNPTPTPVVSQQSPIRIASEPRRSPKKSNMPVVVSLVAAAVLLIGVIVVGSGLFSSSDTPPSKIPPVAKVEEPPQPIPVRPIPDTQPSSTQSPDTLSPPELKAPAFPAPVQPATVEEPEPSITLPTDANQETAPQQPTPEQPAPDPAPMAFPTDPLPSDPLPSEAPVQAEPVQPEPAAEPAPVPTQVKLDIPSADDRQQKRKEIADIFSVASAQSAEQQTEMAKKLLSTGRGTESDPAAQFALFNTARELACDAGQIELAYEAVAAMNEQFVMNAAAVKIDSLQRASTAAVPTAAKASVVPAGIALIDELIATDQHDQAMGLVSTMQTIARRLRHSEGLNELSQRRRAVVQAQREFEVAKAAMEKLAEYPNDADANLAAGKYLVFVKGEFQRGMQMLALGSDSALEKIASLELTSPTKSAAQHDLATAWWDAAEQQSGDLRDKYLVRAAQWYRAAAPRLSGLEAARARTRLKEVEDAGLLVPGMAGGESLAASTVATPVANGESVQSLTGTFHFRGDDTAELRLNGELLGKVSVKNDASVEATVKLGDVITVHLTDARYEHGFRLVFIADEGKHAFYTNRGTWYEYAPADPTQWWDVKAGTVGPPAKQANLMYLAGMQAGRGYGAEAIWGSTTSESYLFHVVDENDLSVLTEVDYPKLRRKGVPVKATFHGAGDDFFDLVINGLPITGGGEKGVSAEVELQVGDCICVRVANTQWETGFIGIFIGENPKIGFGTHRTTWGMYAPLDQQRWWAFNPLERQALLTGSPRSSPKLPAIAAGPPVAVEPLWQQGSKYATVHMFHVVTEADLSEH